MKKLPSVNQFFLKQSNLLEKKFKYKIYLFCLILEKILADCSHLHEVNDQLSAAVAQNQSSPQNIDSFIPRDVVLSEIQQVYYGRSYFLNGQVDVKSVETVRSRNSNFLNQYH